jgi:hypothetical protein
MTLQLCVSRCALGGAAACGRNPPLGQINAEQDDRELWSDEPDDPDEASDVDDDWEEVDPAQLESWIFNDFDWEMDQAYPQRGDYWDDSLDGQWDMAAQAAMTNDEVRHGGSAGGTTPMTKSSNGFFIGHWDLVIGHSNGVRP